MPILPCRYGSSFSCAYEAVRAVESVFTVSCEENIRVQSKIAQIREFLLCCSWAVPGSCLTFRKEYFKPAVYRWQRCNQLPRITRISEYDFIWCCGGNIGAGSVYFSFHGKISFSTFIRLYRLYNSKTKDQPAHESQYQYIS